MVTKETIAIVGLPNKTCKKLVAKLVQENCRLLLIAGEKSAYLELFDQDFLNLHQADIEILDCAKDGCWEADIIVLKGEEKDKKLLERIKEVSTQKIVIGVSVIDDSSKTPLYEANNLQLHFPYSKVVHVLNTGSAEVYIAGDYSEANQIVSEKVAKIGYIPRIANRFSSLLNDDLI